MDKQFKFYNKMNKEFLKPQSIMQSLQLDLFIQEHQQIKSQLWYMKTFHLAYIAACMRFDIFHSWYITTFKYYFLCVFIHIR